MKKVLVTGITGFIGNKIAQRFCDSGYEVVGIDICENTGTFLSYKVDMLDKNEVENVLGNINPDIIIHCAGSANVAYSVMMPEKDFAGNVVITHNLLFAMKRLGMEKTRLVFLSSAAVYGNPISLPITEEMPTNPLSPYALHKVMCEDICRFFVKNYGMNIKIARIFSAYGEGLKKQIFWDMYDKLNKYGKLEMLGTGNESRDYIYIDDLTEALYKIANDNSNNMIYNVANGEEVTIRRATELFADCCNVSKELISFDGIIREGDPLYWCADISKLKSLGYKKVVSMEKGLRNYFDWVKKL